MVTGPRRNSAAVGAELAWWAAYALSALLGSSHGLVEAVSSDQLLKGPYHGAQRGEAEAPLRTGSLNARF